MERRLALPMATQLSMAPPLDDQWEAPTEQGLAPTPAATKAAQWAILRGPSSGKIAEGSTAVTEGETSGKIVAQTKDKTMAGT